MFTDLRNEILCRHGATERYVDTTCRPGFAAIASASKGLAFVEMYAAYEYTVKELVHEGLRIVCSMSMPYGGIRLELLPLVLHPETAAVADAGRSMTWKRRIELFRKANSAQACSAVPVVFPNDGSHFRLSQLYTIWSLFGIAAPVLPTPMHTPLIGELVENRNAIAHGRETAHAVGRRYTKSEVIRKIHDTRDVCMYLASTVDAHCSMAQNLRR